MFSENLIVFPEQEFPDKTAVIHYLTHLENDRVLDADCYEAAVNERELTCATYTIEGVAIPHAKTDAVTKPFVAFARLKTPVPWGSAADEKASLIFLLGVPQTAAAGQSANLHLAILAALSKHLIHASFRQQLANAGSPKELYNLFQGIEVDSK